MSFNFSSLKLFKMRNVLLATERYHAEHLNFEQLMIEKSPAQYYNSLDLQKAFLKLSKSRKTIFEAFLI